MEGALLRADSVNLIERAMCALLALPVIGLLNEALGVSAAGAFSRLASEPSLAQAFLLSLWVAIVSLWLSLKLARAFSGRLLGIVDGGVWQCFLLAIPHSALALGVLLSFSSGGVFMRWVSALTGWNVDPGYFFPRDELASGTILVLIIKEVAFLVAIALPIAKRLPIQSYRAIGLQASLSERQIWNHLIWPQLIRLMQPAIFIVFVFGLSNLEVSLILGPDQPQLIGVRLFDLMMDPNDLNRQAGAFGMVMLIVFLGGCWVAMQTILKPKTSLTIEPILRRSFQWDRMDLLFRLVVCFSVMSLLLWSFALRWPVTEFLPIWTFGGVDRLQSMSLPFLNTLSLGALVGVLSTTFAVLILEYQIKKNHCRIHWVWWIFLWIPALPISAGLLTWLYLIGESPGYTAVLFGHILIALPYAMIILGHTWFSRDARHKLLLKQARISSLRALVLIWIPRHSRLILLAFAVSFSVSCALYTQTILLGGGRVETLMTELMVYSSGDRRLSSIAGLVNLVLPLVIFIGAITTNRWLWANRTGMQGEGFADFR